MSVDALDETLERLAEFESDSRSVVSVYLDLRPEHRATYSNFLQTASKEHENLQDDFAKIEDYLRDELNASTQGAAVFSCAGEPPLFEGLQFETTFDGHRLYVDREPHVFPLARLADQFGTYAALLLNTNSARLYVFSAGTARRQQTVKNKKGKRVSAGGWSQARYQRRLENLHQHHMKEVAGALEQVVKEDDVRKILVAADNVALPLLREELSSLTQDLLVEVSGLDMNAADADVHEATLEAFRESDLETDAEWVARAVDAHRSHGLGTVGATGVKAALERGQVDRLLVPAIPASSATNQQSSGVDSFGTKEQRGALDEATVEEFVTLAHRTDAQITFIEDARLLEPAKGVAAILRFRV